MVNTEVYIDRTPRAPRVPPPPSDGLKQRAQDAVAQAGPRMKLLRMKLLRMKLRTMNFFFFFFFFQMLLGINTTL